MNRALLVFFVLCPLLSFGQPPAREKVDSILKVLSLNKSLRATGKVELLCSLAVAYSPVNHDSAVFYANDGLRISKDIDYEYGQGISLLALGEIQNDADASLAYYLKALLVFEEAKDDYNTGRMLQQIGGWYYNAENFRQALNYFEKAKGYYEKIYNESSVAGIHQSLAATFLELQNFNKALELQSIALEYYRKTGNQQRIAAAYLNMSICYQAFKEYNKALLYASKSASIFGSSESKDYHYAMALEALGYIYYIVAMDSTTIIHADSLLPAGKKANLALAFKHYQSAYEAYKVWHRTIPGSILIKLAFTQEAMGNHKEALGHLKRYIATQDSVLSKDVRLRISAQETKREAALKERQIELNRLQEAGKNKERILFALIAILLCSVIVLIVRNNRKQKRANRSLAAANKHIADEKDKSDELAASLQESIIQKDALTARLSLAADMKTRFLANISHELRTPVTLLTGMLEILRDKAGLKERAGESTIASGGAQAGKEQLEVAYNNSRKLQYMVEEILDLSMQDNRGTKLRAESREIAPLLKKMVYAFKPFIEKEQVTLSYNEYDVQGMHISIDENMLEKIINNLMYNAVKFNEPGGWIKVNLLASTDRTQFMFTINNSGSVISTTDMPRIFDRFYQAEGTAARAAGAGIGLSLVKEFTTLMGGTVEVTSTQGAGTKFTLQFPVTGEQAIIKELEADVPEQQVQAWERFPNRPTVLIVEDNDEMRYYLREVLADKVNLAEAINGKKALEWLEGNKADLVINDMMMPEMGGEEFIANLKRTDAYRKIPVITLTALADSANRLNMLRLGIDDYIVKPFDATELKARVYNLLSNLQERRIFEAAPSEQDDILPESQEAEKFKEKVTAFVLARMKNFEVSVYDLAYELSMSERQLYRLSKKLTGFTPAQMVKEVRLQKAYELLLSGDIYKLDALARQVGFEDTNYFARQFYARFGKRAADFFS